MTYSDVIYLAEKKKKKEKAWVKAARLEAETERASGKTFTPTPTANKEVAKATNKTVAGSKIKRKTNK